jgi:hypothetical protein
MEIIVRDSVLPKEVHQKIKDSMLGDSFPWFCCHSKVSEIKDPSLDLRYDFQFTHSFYQKFSPKSSAISLIEPILEILNPSAIVRIKANLTPVTENTIVYGYHRDYENFDGLTAIYYVNDNNGYTIFDDGTKIDSVENRLLIFDSKIKHTGTSCTDQKVRCVINFNYYIWDR